MVKVSTGTRDQMLASRKSLRDLFQGGVLKIYSGTAPASADDAISSVATNTLLCTITNASSSSLVAQSIDFTFTSNADGTFVINLNGVDCVITVAGGALSAANAATTMYRALGALCGTTYFFDSTTENDLVTNSKFHVDDNLDLFYGKFTVTNPSSGVVRVTAASAGTPFDYSATATGGTNGIVTSVVAADTCGLHFESDSSATAGVIEKLSTQTWSGVAAATGTASFFRLTSYYDGGTPPAYGGGSSTSLARIQGDISTSNSDLNFTSINFVSGATYTIDSFSVTFPES